VDTRGDDDAGATGSEPWHVPDVPEDALERELPPSVAAAAKHAFAARRDGVRIAELLKMSGDGRRGHATFEFEDAELPVHLSVTASPDGSRVEIDCGSGRGATVEILNAGATKTARLDESGNTAVVVPPGLLSLLVTPLGESRPTLQTTWIRIS